MREVKKNPDNSVLVRRRDYIDYSLQCSPSNVGSLAKEDRLPAVVVAKPKRKAAKKRPKEAAPQNP